MSNGSRVNMGNSGCWKTKLSNSQEQKCAHAVVCMRFAIRRLVLFTGDKNGQLVLLRTLPQNTGLILMYSLTTH